MISCTSSIAGTLSPCAANTCFWSMLSKASASSLSAAVTSPRQPATPVIAARASTARLRWDFITEYQVRNCAT